MIFLYIVILFFLLYSLLIIYYWLAWISIPVYQPGEAASVSVSVIIPARNEEQHIGVLLQALEKQSYPAHLFEVIVVDDHSTDQTAAVVQQYKTARLVRLQAEDINSYKKKAIETGIAAASGRLIVTTDADCVPSPGWLSTIVSFWQERKAVFIAAPVAYTHDRSLLQMFQALDFMTLQGITGAAVYKKALSMCNGANLAYEKEAFDTVGGFTGIDNIASGDDMLLMHKIWKQFPQQVYYLKAAEAIVQTQPAKTWREFFNQRIRWASKAGKYADRRITAVLLLVYLFNLSFLGLFIAAFQRPVYWWCLLAGVVTKTIVELPFLYSIANFFKKRSLLWFFFFFQPLHILYTILSGLFGQFGKYEWKGRKVK